MLQIFVSNNIRILGASTPLVAAITAALTVENPEYVKRKARKLPTWGLEQKLRLYARDPYALIVPRGFHSQLVKILQTQGIVPGKVMTYDMVQGMAADFGTWNPNYEPFPYQADAIAAILEDDGVLQAPAGSGKTNMGLYYVKEKGVCALWLTHTKDLMNQTAERAKLLLSDVGKIGKFGDGISEWGEGKLVVGMVQTLQQNPELVQALNQVVGTVVVDEAHHFPAAAFIEVAGQFKAINFLGLTATPQRKDGLESYLLAGIGPILHRVDRQVLYDSGAIIKPTVKFIYTDFTSGTDESETGAVDAGGEDMDYIGLMRELTSDAARLDLVAGTILDEHQPGNYQIVLTESVRYCYRLAEYITAKAAERNFATRPRVAVIHGPLQRYSWNSRTTERAAKAAVENGEAIEYRQKKGGKGWEVKVERYTADEMEAWQISGKRRAEILDEAGAKKVDILIATQLAREGLDIPHLNIGHLATPKRGDNSRQGRTDGAAVEQEIGRIMRADRSNPGKTAIWYDYVDNNVGVLNDQYYSRRKVYQRLGIALGSKPRMKAAEDLLSILPW